MQVQQFDILNLGITLPAGIIPVTPDPTKVPDALPFDLLLNDFLPQAVESENAETLTSADGGKKISLLNFTKPGVESELLQPILENLEINIPKGTSSADSTAPQTNVNRFPIEIRDSKAATLIEPLLENQLFIRNELPWRQNPDLPHQMPKLTIDPGLQSNPTTPASDSILPQRTSLPVTQMIYAPPALPVSEPIVRHTNSEQSAPTWKLTSIPVTEIGKTNLQVIVNQMPTEFISAGLPESEKRSFDSVLVQNKVIEIKITNPPKDLNFVAQANAPRDATERVDSAELPIRVQTLTNAKTEALVIESESMSKQAIMHPKEAHSIEAQKSSTVRTVADPSPTIKADTDSEARQINAEPVEMKRELPGRSLGQKIPHDTTSTAPESRNDQSTAKLLQTPTAEPMPGRSVSPINEQVLSTARVSIPEQAVQTLKPNGHSVQLRIEPEHLGPARLSLTMADDKLQARVVVNDAGAKTVVESSIKSLVDQLAKYDIRVDRIDVSVSGELLKDNGHQPFFNHRAHAHTQRQYYAAAFNMEQAETADHMVTTAPSYISKHGVNILA
jgi:flagellar hook-length control protein FliK